SKAESSYPRISEPLRSAAPAAGKRSIVEFGSERGAELATELHARPAIEGDSSAAQRMVDRAQMGRTMDTVDINLCELCVQPRAEEVDQGDESEPRGEAAGEHE